MFHFLKWFQVHFAVSTFPILMLSLKNLSSLKLTPSSGTRAFSSDIKYPFEQREFWSKNQKLIDKKNQKDVLFVFLEGRPGSGKIDTLKRLSRVLFLYFQQICIFNNLKGWIYHSRNNFYRP